MNLFRTSESCTGIRHHTPARGEDRAPFAALAVRRGACAKSAPSAVGICRVASGYPVGIQRREGRFQHAAGGASLTLNQRVVGSSPTRGIPQSALATRQGRFCLRTGRSHGASSIAAPKVRREQSTFSRQTVVIQWTIWLPTRLDCPGGVNRWVVASSPHRGVRGLRQSRRGPCRLLVGSRRYAPFRRRGEGSALSPLDRERRPPIGTGAFGANPVRTLALSDSRFTGVRDRVPERNGLRYHAADDGHERAVIANANERNLSTPACFDPCPLA